MKFATGTRSGIGIPTAVDQLALRTLIKYMSSVRGIPYKYICNGTQFDESSLKNYVNDKTIKGSRSAAMFQAFSGRCLQIIEEKVNEFNEVAYISQIIHQLFGGALLQSTAIRREDLLSPLITQSLDVTERDVAQAEQYYSGLWRVFRPSDTDRLKSPGFNCSLLQIRRNSSSRGTLTEFRWYYAGRDREFASHSVIAGFVIPQSDRIDFLGRMLSRRRFLSLMTWNSDQSDDLSNHSNPAFGVMLSTGTFGIPICARVQAFYLNGSDKHANEILEANADSELRVIGDHDRESLRDLIPKKEFDRAIDYLLADKPIVGFYPAPDRQYL